MKNRQHTWCFLEYARSISSVYLTTEIDMYQIMKLKCELNNISYISFLIYIISRVIEKYKINVFYQSSFNFLFKPKIIHHDKIYAKFTVDINMHNSRFVYSSIIEDANKLSLMEIQESVNVVKNINHQNDQKLKMINKLNRLPIFLSRLIFALLVKFKKFNQKILGSFTVTSLGHNPIDVFLPISGNVLTFGMGQIKQRAVVCNDKIIIKPILILAMVFDHKIIDGALASDILTQIKKDCENFSQSI